jgi:hypothetical protein
MILCIVGGSCATLVFPLQPETFTKRILRAQALGFRETSANYHARTVFDGNDQVGGTTGYLRPFPASPFAHH